MAITEQVNGSGGQGFSSEVFFAEKVRELREFLAPLSAEREQLEARVLELDREQRRIESAIRALESEPRPPVEPVVERKRVTGRRNWAMTSRPAEKTLARVFQCVATSDEPVSASDVKAKVNVSLDTITRAFAALREDEKIRLAGRRGQAHVYAVMPS